MANTAAETCPHIQNGQEAMDFVAVITVNLHARDTICYQQRDVSLDQ